MVTLAELANTVKWFILNYFFLFLPEATNLW